MVRVRVRVRVRVMTGQREGKENDMPQKETFYVLGSRVRTLMEMS